MGFVMDRHTRRGAQGVVGMSAQLENVTGSAIADREQQEVAQIREALRGLQFGTVTIIVQDGVVVQIDRTEKRRVRQGTGR